MSVSGLSLQLKKAPIPIFVGWCLMASLITYFSMYACRKPFSTGEFASLTIGGFPYKAILIITQVLGYMTSKWLGVLIIPTLTAKGRVVFGFLLIIWAEVMLILFALISPPINFILLFFNGLSLGMVWGVVFGFLEGRRFTELLAFGLAGTIVVASGVLKSIYVIIQDSIHASEFWMPAIIGGLFFPVYAVGLWMLSQVPPQSEEDILLREKRTPMKETDRQKALLLVGPGFLAIILAYTLLTILRDFRDNFAIEIWKELGQFKDPAIFARVELIIGLIVISGVGALAFFRDNRTALFWTHWLMMAGLSMALVSSILFTQQLLDSFNWMVIMGSGLFLAYIPVQIVFFERLIGAVRLKDTNAGYFVYLCDATGYLGSVAILILKELSGVKLSWSAWLLQGVFWGISLAFILVLFSNFFFRSLIHSIDNENRKEAAIS